ncbi:MAG TPA: hypothetical protein PLN48_11955 [Lachnospiraceae bacterium]|jgi:hypothetical protein|nr:hypothetical protein [Lachnospiraceae bacterium]
MKKRTLIVAIGLAALSALLYFIQFVLYHDLRDTTFYMLQDWAFLPLQVALVTVIVGSVVEGREKANRLEKTQMLTSTFFSEVGLDLLKMLEPAVKNADVLKNSLAIAPEWTSQDFAKAKAAVRTADPAVELKTEEMKKLRELLCAGRMAMLVISSNPALLEHEGFTDMLWAVFHLTDELSLRNLDTLSQADRAHINSDAQRVLTETLANWVRHMEHLKKEYPYLFQLEVYRNPFAARRPQI